MKKHLFISLLPLILTSCNGNSTHDLKLSILCPTGAPSIAFYSYSNDAKFETNNNVANITGMMNGTADYDVVVVDTTSGIQAIHNGAPYKMAATITLGNFYIASTNSSSKTTIEDSDIVVLFGNQNAVPYKIFSYLYGTKINAEFCGGGVDKAAQVLETGKNLATGHNADWVFIAEPYLYRAKNNPTSIIYNKENSIINVQNVYKEKSGNLPLMQASIFIKNSVSKEDGINFLNDIKNDINIAIESPEKIKEGINQISDSMLADTKFGISADNAYEIMKTNGLGLGYLDSKENKNSIDSYISLFGMEPTNEEIYF